MEYNWADPKKNSKIKSMLMWETLECVPYILVSLLMRSILQVES